MWPVKNACRNLGQSETSTSKTDLLIFLTNKRLLTGKIYIRFLTYLKAIYRKKWKNWFFNSCHESWDFARFFLTVALTARNLKCDSFWFIHILSYRFSPIRSQLETVLGFWLVNVLHERMYIFSGRQKYLCITRFFFSCSHLTFSLVKRSSLTNFNIVLNEINKIAGYSVIVYKVVIKENTLVYSGGGEAKRWMLK